MEDLLHKEITDKVLKSFYDVYYSLEYGFLEKVYENSMYLDLIEKGLLCYKQKPINVTYKNTLVGEYFADLLVEDKVIIEMKSCETLCEEHEFQLINYLKATDIEVGLLLNFGKKPSLKGKFLVTKIKLFSEVQYNSVFSAFYF